MPSDVVFPADAPRPRLCHLIKWPDFDGYGFNLHAEKVRSGQYIGKVDADSPAECAGLREGDRIVEVNGVNIANENHKQVVERIKAVPNETKLLVLDSVGEKYYYGGKKPLLVKGTQNNVLAMKTPVPRPGRPEPTSDPDADSLDGGDAVVRPPQRNGHRHNGSLDSASETEERRSHGSSIASDNDADKLSRNGSSTMSTPPTDRMEQLSFGKVSPTSQTSVTPPTTPTSTSGGKLSEEAPGGRTGGGGGGPALNLNMTVSEMRAMLAQRKRRDPKMEGLDFRKKHDIVQGM